MQDLIGILDQVFDNNQSIIQLNTTGCQAQSKTLTLDKVVTSFSMGDLEPVLICS
jgi:hypothetical protein